MIEPESKLHTPSAPGDVPSGMNEAFMEVDEELARLFWSKNQHVRLDENKLVWDSPRPSESG